MDGDFLHKAFEIEVECQRKKESEMDLQVAG